MKHTIFYLFAAVSALFFLVSCDVVERFFGEEPIEEPAVIRVGASVLTERDITETLGENAEAEEILNFIREWSNTELTYRAALDMGIHREESVQRTINDMRRNFLSILYIQRTIEGIGDIEILTEDIEREFAENSHLYVRREISVRAARIVTPNLRSAWLVRNGLTAANFHERAASYSMVEVPAFETVRFSPHSAFNPAVRDAVFGTRVGGITSPLSEDGRYSIYLILAREPAGSPAALHEVIDDVKRNLFARKQTDMVSTIFARLRDRYDYSFDREFIERLANPQDEAIEDTVVEEALISPSEIDIQFQNVQTENVEEAYSEE